MTSGLADRRERTGDCDLLESMQRSPIVQVTGVWRFVREPERCSRCRSLPGHLLHFILRGSYALRIDECDYAVRAGDMIYYHNSEAVEWLGNESSVEFYSVGFHAPGLEPPPVEERVFAAPPIARDAFAELYTAAGSGSAAQRTFGTLSALCRILELVEERRENFLLRTEGQQQLWWKAERLMRRERWFRPVLDDLAAAAGCSRSGIVRACRAATGTSPIKRAQTLRMQEARALLLFSSLGVGQIAAELGYPRIHEFSREFSRYFGMPPTAVRH